jgi:Putative restriction endonuclease
VTDRFLNDMRCFRGGLTLGVHKIPFRVFSSIVLGPFIRELISFGNTHDPTSQVFKPAQSVAPLLETVLSFRREATISLCRTRTFSLCAYRCIRGEKEFPDLALEIALTTGGLSKLEIYRRFNVPEVWFWRRQALEIFALRDDGAAYEAVSQSRLLPDLDIALVERCVAIRSWQQARREFRAGFGGNH